VGVAQGVERNAAEADGVGNVAPFSAERPRRHWRLIVRRYREHEGFRIGPAEPEGNADLKLGFAVLAQRLDHDVGQTDVATAALLSWWP
jgi:hypothetical protein